MYSNAALLFRLARDASEDRIHRAERQARLRAARDHRRRHRRAQRDAQRDDDR